MIQYLALFCPYRGVAPDRLLAAPYNPLTRRSSYPALIQLRQEAYDDKT